MSLIPPAGPVGGFMRRQFVVALSVWLVVIGLWGWATYDEVRRQHDAEITSKLAAGNAMLGQWLDSLHDDALLADSMVAAGRSGGWPTLRTGREVRVYVDGGVDSAPAPPAAWRRQLSTVRADGTPVLLPPYLAGGEAWLPVGVSSQPGRVTVVAARAPTLVALWARLGLPENSAVSILTAQGMLVLRWPYHPEMVGRDISAGPLHRAVVRDGPVGRVRLTATMTDGVERFVSWAPVTGHDGLTLSTGIAVDHVRRAWFGSYAWTIGLTSLAGVAVMAWSTLTLQRVRAAEVSRQAAVGALAENEQRWMMALAGSGLGVWDWSVPAQRVYFSARWKSMLGFAEDEVGDSLDEWSSRVHPDDLPAVMKDLTAHLDGHTPAYVNEHRMRCADGSYKWILDQGRVFSRDAAGRPVRMVGTHTDITDRKEADQARLERRAAEQASRQKTEFLARMSHELRTPLNAVLGFAQLMDADTSATPRQRDRIGRILTAGDHLLELIDEILDLTSAESGLVSLETERLDLVDLVRHCLPMVATQAERMQVDVHGDPSGGAPAWVSADPRRLRQVVLNLLTNAVKYNRVGGLVHVSVSVSGGEVALAVRDTGSGLSDDQMARLFRPFDRLGAERTDVPGTGIGLVLTRRLVDLMGGRIEVDGRPGEGSTFRVVLPSHADEAAT